MLALCGNQGGRRYDADNSLLHCRATRGLKFSWLLP
jgi:hypothetical protein